MVAKTRHLSYRPLELLQEKNHTESVFSRMPRAVTAEIIQMKFVILNAWLDVVIYFCSSLCWLFVRLCFLFVTATSFLVNKDEYIFQTASKLVQRFGRGRGRQIFAFLLASNTAYCAAAHTRDIGYYWRNPVALLVLLLQIYLCLCNCNMCTKNNSKCYC